MIYYININYFPLNIDYIDSIYYIEYDIESESTLAHYLTNGVVYLLQNKIKEIINNNIKEIPCKLKNY